MKNENTRRLAEALRSGEYQQIKGALCRATRNGYGYCCLGVGSVVAGVRRGWHEPEDDSWHDEPTMFEGYQSLAPDGLLEWLGLDTSHRDWEDGYHVYVDWPDGLPVRSEFNEPVTTEVHEIDLASLNDGGFTFPQIADLIDYFGVR